MSLLGGEKLLAQLLHRILSGITAAAKAEVVFENEMSSAFRLKRIVALYDGAPLATKTDDNLIVFRTNMDAGHGGAAGRFDRLHETAFATVFALKVVGKT